jgi:hypothetical protein
MSHCNITMRNRYSSVEQQAEYIVVLEARLKHTGELLKHAEDNLRAIFDRIDNGEEVYLDYPDGHRTHIQAAPEPK